MAKFTHVCTVCGTFETISRSTAWTKGKVHSLETKGPIQCNLCKSVPNSNYALSLFNSFEIIKELSEELRRLKEKP